MKAHQVYTDPTYLELAQDAWQTANANTISPEQAASRYIPGRNITLAISCKSASLAGGTFYRSDENNGGINTISSGYFLIVSSLLANATGDSVYFEAASRSFTFLTTQLYNNVTGEAVDGIDARTCGTSPPLVLVGTALFIEGATILGDVTGNQTVKDFASNLAQKSIKNLALRNSQGIIQEDRVTWTTAGDEFGGHFIRALSTLYAIRGPVDAGLQGYIRAFVAVQYNALVDLAGNDNVYAGSWLDSPTPYNTGNQTSAIDLLLGGLVVGGDSTTSSGSLTRPTASTSTSTSAAGPNAAHKDNLGAIVGGVIGGTFVLSMMGVLGWLIVRQRCRTRMVALAARPFEKTAVETIHPVHPQQNQNDEVKQLPGPPSNDPSSTIIASRSDGATQETNRSGRDREDGRRINIGSLLWELSELLRRRDRDGSEEESPPAYTASSSNSRI